MSVITPSREGLKIKINIILIIFLIIFGSSLTVQSQPVAFYRFDIALLPFAFNASAINLNKLYLFSKNMVFHGLVAYDGRSPKLTKIYFSSLNNKYVIKLINEIAETARSLFHYATPVNSEEYYLLQKSSVNLVYCGRMLRAQTSGIDILYSASGVPLRGITLLGTYNGAKILAYFEILSATYGICGNAVTGESTKTGLLLTTVVIGLASVSAYLYFRRSGARGNDNEMW